jgi:TrmH family RNA methyltransferase
MLARREVRGEPQPEYAVSLKGRMITSAHNPKLQLVRTLAGRARERREAALFLAEGIRLIEEALAANWPIEFVLHTAELSQRGHQLLEAVQERGIEAYEVEGRLLGSISDTETSQGILAVLRLNPLPLPFAPDFVLIADSIRDPGNLGTLVRTADAAGVQAVLLPPETTDAFAPKVVRAGMGAHFHLPIQAMDWLEIGRLFESGGLAVYLADMHGESCWEMDLRQPLALIVGSEAEGATEAAKRFATQTVCVPMQGKAESLNAAVAGAVLMFEILRQRRQSS